MNDPESEKAMRDAMFYGTGFMQDGKRIAPDDVYVKPDDAGALAKKLMSQVGDDVHHVYDHEALLKSAAATLRTQAAEIERLQEALGKTESEPQSCRDEVGAPTENAVLRREWVELKARAEKSEAERDALRDREKHFASVLSVADRGQYRNDWDAAIRRVVAERDALREALVKADELARAMQREEDCFGLPDFMQAALASYRKARGDET